MGSFSIKNFIKRRSFKAVILFFCAFVFIYGITVSSVVTKTYNFKVGDIAKDDIEAQREITDQQSTDTAKSQAVNSVSLQYSKKSEIRTKVIAEINTIFNEAISDKDTNLDEKSMIAKLKQNTPLSLEDVDLKNIADSSKVDLITMRDFLLNTLSDIYDNNTIVEDNGDNTKEAAESMKKAKTDVATLLSSSVTISKLTNELKNTGLNIANLLIEPNFFYDKEKTDQLRKEAEKKVDPVIIKKGQIVVKKGEPVTQHQIEILKDLGLLNSNYKFNWYVYSSLALLVFLVQSLQWFYIRKYKKDIYENIRKMTLISILSVISIILTRSFSMASPYLLPLACIPMIMTLLFDYKLSLSVNVLSCVIISQVVGFNPEVMILAIVNAAMGALILKNMQQRNDIIYSALYLTIINVVLTFCVGSLLSNNVFEVLKRSGFSMVGSIASAVLTIGLLPFFENNFDIVTTVKLLELSNPNNELLRKLLIEAPGTYHHSILVANLAEVAAEAIGGNTVLTRVAAYYHDIGKIKRPYFFKENQLGNDNPHDKITPNLSTLIIISHVKDGLEMAKEYKLPKNIQDIIVQHHGTSLVKYFYLTVKNNSETPEDVKEDSFRYPGPIPQNKEAGIIMLADAVEASVRSIADPSQGKIEEMVNNIFKERLNEGQLDNCDITLKDLDIIRRSFLKSFSGIYHKRIEYPTDKWENKVKE